MAQPDSFLSGVVEGFYGRQWSWPIRQAYAGYLQSLGLNCYLYCPKGDPYLRKRWQDPWPADTLNALHQLGRTYTERNLYWGVGLSPFALYQNYGQPQREQLRRKLEEIESLDAPLLAILFDDMPGDMDGLAQRQAEIVSDVQHWMPGYRLLVCPTYYSYDPALEKHFGVMPAHYREELGRALAAEVDVFWTGNKVCSDAISLEDIQPVNTAFGRPVTLWDNYPVNDGAVRSNHLYLDALEHRGTELRGFLRGHLCNPMNQGLLSLPAMLGLARLHGNSSVDESWLAASMGEDVWECLQRDSADFHLQGLSGLGRQRCEVLADDYSGFTGDAAGEVAAWLRGEYTFDPACLTD